MTTYPSSPVDSLTASTLALIAGDPIHSRDRELIVRAVHAEAEAQDGLVNINGVRRHLRDESGHLVVNPRCVGAVIQALCKAGVLEFQGWTVTVESSSGNNGRPLRFYRRA